MKPYTRTITSAAIAALAIAGNAHAENGAIMDALKHRENLSVFTDTLISSGVAAELKPGESYTVFAPTNEAFARITGDKYPCVAAGKCKEQVADIMRNHIVPGQVSFSGPTKGAVFSIDGLNLNLGKHHGAVKTVAGREIVNRGQVLGGIICEIDGIIASPQEKANVSAKLVPVAVQQQVIERTTVDKVYYAPDGTPDGMSKVTTYSTEPVAPAASQQ